MSGSGSSSSGSRSFDTFPDCSTLVFSTQLSSPKPNVIVHLKPGEELDVALETRPDVTVVVALFNGQVAGGLASPETARLRACIEQGTNYNATVLDITGGQVRVRIHPV